GRTARCPCRDPGWTGLADGVPARYIGLHVPRAASMTIHPAHLAESRRAFGAASALLVILIVVTTLRLPAAASDVSNFLPLHMALETLSIVVASLIFGVIWSSRHENLPANLLWLASAFLAVALLDFLHVLSLDGMPDFIVPGSHARSTYFWLVAGWWARWACWPRSGCPGGSARSGCPWAAGNRSSRCWSSG